MLLNLKYKKVGIEDRKYTAKGPFGKNETAPLVAVWRRGPKSEVLRVGLAAGSRVVASSSAG